MKQEIFQHLETLKAELFAISHEILNNPEVGHQEFKAAELQCSLLEKYGFKVERNFAELPTAYCAEIGSGDVCVAIFSEYDALPGIGHACGHHLIALTALGAGIAAGKYLKSHNLPGRILVIGSPAEEALGGKVDIIRKGKLSGVDYALISHPFQTTNTDPGNLAVGRYDVIYHGRAAHASVSPQDGVNALDAQNLLFAGIAFWRQQLPLTARVHGTITSGGAMPNIIPDYTCSFFYVRSTENTMQNELEQRFERIANGAAMMTDCKLELRKYPNSYTANRPDPELDNTVREMARQSGFVLGEITQKISTDFANVTLECRGSNFMYDIIGDSTIQAPLHSEMFLMYAGKPYAFEQSLRAAGTLAMTTLKILGGLETTEDNYEVEFK